MHKVPHMPNATLLYLARHGEATEPGNLCLPGPDLPLTKHGLAQAKALAAQLRDVQPVAVYASDARRAIQTGATIAAACGVGLVTMPELREIDFGNWAGRTYAEIVADQPGAAGYFSDPTSRTPPGGEHVATVARRVDDALRTIAVAHPGSAVVVVGHAGAFRLALCQILGMPLAAYWRLRLDLASFSLLAWSESGFIVERLNATSHLMARGNVEDT